jgi:hypothetical protein
MARRGIDPFGSRIGNGTSVLRQSGTEACMQPHNIGAFSDNSKRVLGECRSGQLLRVAGQCTSMSPRLDLTFQTVEDLRYVSLFIAFQLCLTQ